MDFKLSYYTIITQVTDETLLLFSTRSSKTLAIKKHLLNALIDSDFSALPDSMITEMIDMELLVPKNENELHTIIEDNKNAIADSDVLYQVIQPSANCQLGCGYCGQDHKKEDFTSDFDDLLLERLEYKLSHQTTFKTLNISWFGGEPLMSLSSIKRLTPKLIALAEKYKVAYTSKMVTNGLSLKPEVFLDLVQHYKVTYFEITLDGTAEFHDKRRFLKTGAQSFDIIFNHLIAIFALPNFKELGASIGIRCNVDKTNYEGVVPLIQLMRQHNFHEYISHFYVAPIHSWGNDAHLMSLEKADFADKEIEWIMAQLENDFTPNLIPQRTHQVCMAVDPNAELIDANGLIFNCTEVSYVPVYKNSSYVLGNIKEISADNLLPKRPLLNWNDLVLSKDTRFPCPTCKMLPVCAGSCPKMWEEGILSCPSTKFNIEDKLALSYLVAQTGIDTFKTMNT